MKGEHMSRVRVLIDVEARCCEDSQSCFARVNKLMVSFRGAWMTTNATELSRMRTSRGGHVVSHRFMYAYCAFKV